MSVRRTPPNTPATTTNLTQVRSDSDIPKALSSSPYDSINITSRSKRPPPTMSPKTNELQEFKQEIRQMLTVWKKEQEEYFTKITIEQSNYLKNLVSELASLKSQNSSMQKSFLEIEKSVSFIGKQYDDMATQIELLQKEKRAYRDSIQQLETKIRDLQQLSRSSAVEIRNVPTKEKESVNDLCTIITDIGSAIKMLIDRNDIRDVYRLPGKPGTIRPIVAELTNVEKKNLVISSVRNFNKTHQNESSLNTHSIGLTGERRRIYVAEYLPASSRKLLFMAREFAKRMNFKYCWTANGNIFLRKVEGAKQHLIKSEQSLNELQTQPSE